MDQNTVETVNPQVFALVKAPYLVERRSRLEASKVPVYLVTSKEEHLYRVAATDWPTIALLAQDPASLVEFALPRQWTSQPQPPPPPGLSSTEEAFFVRWNALMALSPGERVQELSRSRAQLEAKAATAGPEEKAKLVNDVTGMAFLVNHASIDLAQSGLPGGDPELIRETTEVIRAVLALVEDTPQAVTLFQTLRNLSNGHTLDHIVRVFVLSGAFHHSFNRMHGRGLNQKLRAVFAEGYRSFYRRLLPQAAEHHLTSDALVRLAPLTPQQVQVFSLGALMHDIGKVMDLGYFEREDAYDATRIQQHPIIGVGLFQRIYGSRYEDARRIIGDHHHYLQHRDGYGLLRSERTRGLRPSAHPVCSISDTLEPFLTGQALGYYPVEVCAIVDVYDALTDPARKYRQGMEAGHALEFIDEHFRATGKLDPVLLDLFVDFLREMAVGVPDEMGFQVRYERHKAHRT